MNIEIENGAVTKDGELIGTIQDGTCYLTREIGPTVKAAINSENDAKLKFEVGAPPQVPSGEDGDAPEGGGINQAPAAPSPAPSFIESPHDPRPERNPYLGDKCPRLIAWTARQKGGK